MKIFIHTYGKEKLHFITIQFVDNHFYHFSWTNHTYFFLQETIKNSYSKSLLIVNVDFHLIDCLATGTGKHVIPWPWPRFSCLLWVQPFPSHWRENSMIANQIGLNALFLSSQSNNFKIWFFRISRFRCQTDKWKSIFITITWPFVTGFCTRGKVLEKRRTRFFWFFFLTPFWPLGSV